MNALDVVILSALVLAAIGGWRLGFIARVVSWLGLGLGLVLAAHFLSTVVDAFSLTTPTSRLLAATALLVGGAFVGQAVGMLVGARLHGGIPMGPLRSADRGVGAAIGAAGVVMSV